MKSDNSNIKGFSLLTAFSVTEKVIAFVYQAIIAAVLGAGIVTDSYYSASQLFDLIDTTVLGAIIVSVIHIYTNLSHRENEKAGFAFLSNVNTILTILMSAIAILICFFARPFSYLIAPGFEEEGRDSLVLCIRLLSVIPPITVAATVRQALLRQKKCFLIVNARSLCISVCGMLAVLLLSRRDPTKASYLCFGYVASNLIFAVLLHIRSVKFGRVGFVKPVYDENVKRLIKMSVPTVISTGIVRLSLMIDQVIASTVETGAVTHLNYAHSLYNMVHSVLIVNLCMILLTDFTNLNAKNDYAGMVEKLKSSVSSIFLLLVPVTILTIVFSDRIVSIAYERGAFGGEAVKKVAVLLLVYAFGFIPALLNSVFTQVLFSFGKTRTAMVNSIISLTINISLSIVLSRFVGLVGVALGTTVSISIASLFYKRSVRKCLPGYRWAVTVKYLIKLAAASVSVALIGLVIRRFIDHAFWSFAAATVISFIVFFALLLAMKEETTVFYFNIIVPKFKKKQKTDHTDDDGRK